MDSGHWQTDGTNVQEMSETVTTWSTVGQLLFPFSRIGTGEETPPKLATNLGTCAHLNIWRQMVPIPNSCSHSICIYSEHTNTVLSSRQLLWWCPLPPNVTSTVTSLSFYFLPISKSNLNVLFCFLVGFCCFVFGKRLAWQNSPFFQNIKQKQRI